MGGFSYPHGMAGTKRIQHAISALKDNPDVSIRVVILSQSSHDNVLQGTCEGIPYETVMGDLARMKMMALLPLLYFKTANLLRRYYRANFTNIIYNYGPINLNNVIPLYYFRKLGFKVILDIVEDYDVAMNISSSFFHRIKMHCITSLSRKTKDLASGVIVISSHLKKKYVALTKGKIPIHYRPISVDFDYFPDRINRFGNLITLFYAGSFGKKDGVPVLLDAFDRIASKYNNIRLALTGKGSPEVIQATLSRIESSPHKNRIEYLGYLDDEVYYKTLNNADILCMTRIDLAYANAGFPFKLGEFLASGKPVIASRVSDVEMLLENKKDVLLVKPGDVDEIVCAVDYLLSHQLDAAEMGSRGRKIAKSHFDYTSQGKSLLIFLKSLQ